MCLSRGDEDPTGGIDAMTEVSNHAIEENDTGSGVSGHQVAFEMSRGDEVDPRMK